jgi:hypothetical protein
LYRIRNNLNGRKGIEDILVGGEGLEPPAYSV